MKTKIITTATALFFIAGGSWAADAKYGDAACCVDGENNDIHDAGLYWLKLWNRLYVGEREGKIGSGNYPGEKGVVTLYIGNFWVGTNAWGTPRVSGEWDRVLGLLWSDGSSWNQRPPYIEKCGDLDSYLKVTDSYEEINLVVEQHGLQWSEAKNDDYIIFHYRILNNSGRDFNDEFVAFYYDFDVGGSLSYIDDKVGIDNGRKMTYMYDDEPKHPYVGLRVLDGKPHTAAVTDIMNEPETHRAKWALMTSGKWETRSEPYDWRVCLSIGPHSCKNGDKIGLAFAVVAGMNLAELQANADAAYKKYWEIFTGLAEFGARALAGEVELSWEPTINYAGFNIYRAEAGAGASLSPTKVNRHLITGQKPFKYVDSSVVAGVTYDYTLEAVTLGGAKERFGPLRVKAQGKAKKATFNLSQNYPNPARGTTTIAFALAESGEVKLEVFDLSGRKVATAAEGPRPAGENQATLDTRNLAAGVYVYRLQAGDEVASKRLAVVK